MNPETQQSESPYCVRIKTETGQSATVPIAIWHRSSWKSFFRVSSRD